MSKEGKELHQGTFSRARNPRDSNLDMENKTAVDHMVEVLKIVFLCSNPSSDDRPSMRHILYSLRP
jgi:hypothetical protein